MKNKLVALGAPELPEGYFYRVVTDFIGTQVQVRRRRRIGSAWAGQAYVFAHRHANAESALVRACRLAAYQARDSVNEKARKGSLAAYLGDHR